MGKSLRAYYVCPRGHKVHDRTDGSCPECDVADLKARVGLLERLLGPPCRHCGGTGLRMSDGHQSGNLWTPMAAYRDFPEMVSCEDCEGLGREILSPADLAKYLADLVDRPPPPEKEETP